MIIYIMCFSIFCIIIAYIAEFYLFPYLTYLWIKRAEDEFDREWKHIEAQLNKLNKKDD